MRHCPECGAGARREGAKFCEECGFAFTAGGEGHEATVVEVVQEAAPAPRPIATPPPAVTPAATASGDTLTVAMPSKVILWAAGLLVFSAFFPWVSGAARISNGMGVPAELLWNRNAPAGGFAVGWVVIILAVLVVVAALFPILEPMRRFLGAITAMAAVVLIAQWIWALQDMGSADSWLSYIGVGVYAVFAAGAIIAFAPGRKR